MPRGLPGTGLIILFLSCLLLRPQLFSADRSETPVNHHILSGFYLPPANLPEDKSIFLYSLPGSTDRLQVQADDGIYFSRAAGFSEAAADRADPEQHWFYVFVPGPDTVKAGWLKAADIGSDKLKKLRLGRKAEFRAVFHPAAPNKDQPKVFLVGFRGFRWRRQGNRSLLHENVDIISLFKRVFREGSGRLPEAVEITATSRLNFRIEQSIAELIRRAWNPGDRIIIHATSFGAAKAYNLCRYLEQFAIETDLLFYAEGLVPERLGRQMFPDDSCLIRDSKKDQLMQLPSSVKTALNMYQLYDEYHGLGFQKKHAKQKLVEWEIQYKSYSYIYSDELLYLNEETERHLSRSRIDDPISLYRWWMKNNPRLDFRRFPHYRRLHTAANDMLERPAARVLVHYMITGNLPQIEQTFPNLLRILDETVPGEEPISYFD